MNWDGFGPLILPYATTVSAPLLKQHVRLAAIEFFSYTKAWQAELAALTADGVKTAFPLLTLPPDSAVEKLLTVEVTDANGNKSEPSVKTPLYGARLARQNAPDLIAFMTAGRAILNVLPKRPAGETIVPTVALKPSMAALTMPDDLFEQFGMDIAKGALASLLAIKDKPWTDTSLARLMYVEFNNAKAVTSRQVERGFATSQRRSAIRWY